MSAYLSRLIQRFSPQPADEGGALQPFVRSRSPIAELDQRLGLGPGLGLEPRFGLEPSIGHSPSYELDPGQEHEGPLAEPPSPPNHELSPSPAQPEVIQRKLAGPITATPTPAAATPMPAATQPAPSVVPRPPIEPHVPEPARPAIVTVDRTPAVELGPRHAPEPDRTIIPAAPSPEAPTIIRPPTPTPAPAPAPAPGRVESRTIERIVERVESHHLAPPAPSIGPIVPSGPIVQTPAPSHTAAQLDSTAPAALAPSRARVERGDARPWVPFVREAPATTPTLAPRPGPAPRLEPARSPLVVEPRRPTPAAFVPDPGEARQLARVEPTTRSSTAARTPEPVAPPTAAPPQPQTPTPVNGRLDIESISQIGPLARHFPNRRRFRLRYR